MKFPLFQTAVSPAKNSAADSAVLSVLLMPHAMVGLPLITIRLIFFWQRCNLIDQNARQTHDFGMTTEMLTLCFAARPSPNGELNILGATDVIFVPQFPIAISCSLVSKIRFRKIEEGLKEIKFSIIDSDGNSLQPSPPAQQVNIQIPSGSSSASAAIVVAIHNLQIPKAGEYEIGLAINGRQEMTVPVFVRLPLSPQPG